ncbi:hypothetical protein GCM10027280_63190 [Micromonospora polyrhachis]
MLDSRASRLHSSHYGIAKRHLPRQMRGKDAKKRISSAAGVHHPHPIRWDTCGTIRSAVGSTTGSYGNYGGPNTELTQVASSIHRVIGAIPKNGCRLDVVHDIEIKAGQHPRPDAWIRHQIANSYIRVLAP